MALKIVETKAIISAQDKTGATFSEVAQKLKNMEGLAKRAGETAGRIGGPFGGIASKADAAARTINATGLAIAELAVVGVEKLAKLAESVIDVGAEFDKLARRQQAVLNISEQQQGPLLEQATIIGATTPFKKLQVIEAQTELAKRGIPVDAIPPVVEQAAKYAQAQGVGLHEATKLLEAAAFAEGKRGASPKDLEHIADTLVRASQLSGMGAEEMEAFLRGHAAEAAGVGLPFLMAQGAAMHLAHIPDPGAAAVRFASQLSKPTPEALDALGAMGIHFNDYARAGTAMTAANLSSEFERELGGRKLSAIGLKKVQAVLSNKDIAGDEEKLTKRLTKILQEEPKKPGGKSPDARAIAKIIKKFWEESIESVDIEGLERALLKKRISGTQAVGIFGKRGGLAFKALAEHADDVEKFEKQIKEVPPGLAAREAEKQMSGFAGAKMRFEGGWQELLTTLAKDNEKWMTPLYDMGARLEGEFVNASPKVRQLGEAAAAAAAGFAILEGAIGALKFVDSLGGKGTMFGSAAGMLGGAASMLFGAPMFIAGAGLVASTSGLNEDVDEFTRQRKFRWLGNEPPEAGRFTPWPAGLKPPAFELKGAARVGIDLQINLADGLSLRELGRQSTGDVGVSMPP